MNFLFLLQTEADKGFADSIKNSPFGPPCPPLGAHLSVTLTLIFCFAVAFATILAFIFHAITRECPISRDEFKDANDRVVARITFLTLRQGEDLRLLCLMIACDLIRIMKYVQQQVSDCSREHGKDDTEHTVIMLQLLRETRRIHSAARLIKFALYFRPLLHAAFELTTDTTTRFLAHWAELLHEYRLKHPECEHRFPA
jgi:hypothetical protein